MATKPEPRRCERCGTLYGAFAYSIWLDGHKRGYWCLPCFRKVKKEADKKK